MTPSISIIMPLYNAERFLKEALVCVSRQTFQDYELICINDGSNDSTVEIVQSFQKKDSRIKLLNNGHRSGAAFARNCGIKESRGEYLIFLDGDDVFEETMLSLAYEKAKRSDADVVMFEYIHSSSENIYIKKEVKHSTEYQRKFYTKVITVRDIAVCDFLLWSSSPCNKIYKKNFIEDNRLEFQNLSCENDTYFVDMAFLLASRIIFLDSPKVMIYARDHFTPNRISTERDPMCIYYAMAKIKEEMKIRGIFEKLHKVFYYRAFYYLAIILKTVKNEKTKREFFDFLKKQGLDELLDCFDEKCGVDRYLEEQKNLLIDSKMGDDWEIADFMFDVFLQDNLDRVCRLFKDCKANGKQIGIWGIGHKGEKFLGFCNNNNLKIDMVIDRDEAKHGKKCEEYYVQSPKSAVGLDVVISVPLGIYDSVKQTVESYNKEIEVIDLHSFLCMV